jgi:hypothetical protein
MSIHDCMNVSEQRFANAGTLARLCNAHHIPTIGQVGPETLVGGLVATGKWKGDKEHGAQLLVVGHQLMAVRVCVLQSISFSCLSHATVGPSISSGLRNVAPSSSFAFLLLTYQYFTA